MLLACASHDDPCHGPHPTNATENRKGTENHCGGGQEGKKKGTKWKNKNKKNADFYNE